MFRFAKIDLAVAAPGVTLQDCCLITPLNGHRSRSTSTMQLPNSRTEMSGAASFSGRFILTVAYFSAGYAAWETMEKSSHFFVNGYPANLREAVRQQSRESEVGSATGP